MKSNVLILLFSVLCCTDAYKFLVVCPLALPSVTRLGERISKHLVNSGHEVTFVTAFPKNKTSSRFREIDVSSLLNFFEEESTENIEYQIKHRGERNEVLYLLKVCSEIVVPRIFEQEQFRRLLEDPKEKFDAVIVDLFETEVLSGLAALYEVPMIWSYSLGPQWSVLRLIDETPNPSYVVDWHVLSNQPPLTFSERVEELWLRIQWYIFKYFITLPYDEATYIKHFTPLFAKRGRTLPPYKDVMYNVSLILSNEHQALGNIPSTPQNFKFVGGYHIDQPTKPLSKELQDIMDNSKHGVIYFSMGSHWQAKGMPEVLKKDLLELFGTLKQTVIFKYEDDDLINVPKNVVIKKWAPQQSILAHPNLIIFISHGGHLSFIEAVHFGVPMIGTPLHLDQFKNINKAVKKGYAIKVDMSFNLAKDLKVAIEEMVSNPIYRQKIKEYSAVYHHRLVHPGKEVVHWIEHVVETRGAPHLRSPALDLYWYQKLYLDLAGLILGLLLVLKVAIQMLLRKSRKEDLRKKLK